MPANKNAHQRYLIIDRCLSNRSRKWTWKDLLDAVNRDLQNEGYPTIGKTTLFEDLKDIEERVYKSEIEKTHGQSKKTVYYRYADPDYSIRKQPLNQQEALHLRTAIQVLSRFKGLPQFEWVHELQPLLETRMGLVEEHTNPIISFDTNDDYRGLEHLTPLFHAILNKRVLNITYQDFKSPVAYEREFHPQHLKQYNHRWFVFGEDPADTRSAVITLALDRIKSMEELDLPYRETKTDWKTYFDDIIGVTRNSKPVTEVLILIKDEQQAAYIETKPLHQSQKKIRKTEMGFETTIRVIPNFELIKLLLSFGRRIEVLAPESLRQSIQQQVLTMYEFYFY